MTVAVSSPITAAYLSALEDVLPANRIGDAIKPESPEKPPATFYPYLVLYVGITSMSGTLVEPHEDGLFRLQVNCVGRTRESAEALRDLARPILLDTSVSIDGHIVVSTEHVNTPQTTHDTEVNPPVFTAVDVVNVLITPAPSGS